MQDEHLIKELQHAFSRSAKDGVLDLDQLLVHRDSLSILRLEDLYEETKGIIPPFRQSNFFIVYVKQGNGKRTIGPHNFEIKDRSLVVIPKHTIHAATYTSKPYGYIISFNPDFFIEQAFSYKLLTSKQILKPVFQPYLLLDEIQSNEVSHIFERIIEECNSGFEERKQMIAVKILELLILCDRFFTQKVECDCLQKYSETIETFHELIEHHFHKHRSVHFYAAALHTHPNNLNLVVKSATGLTAKQTITNRIMIEAKYLLTSTSSSIKEIAYELGFEDPNYFITFFKKEQAASPARYRTQLV
ncbi:MAG TPA: AraC family transcriptional regulator [Flavisolibacter sp.]|jgi:AraC-like DNA-binding protein|nr:AraC family transcriptional regulator [Flavisolibacter sp.]